MFLKTFDEGPNRDKKKTFHIADFDAKKNVGQQFATLRSKSAFRS